jgi:hypothetical protein
MASKRNIIHTDIAIAGGGCGGTAAALQAARMGAAVLLVEETPYLGGMLTAAGVVAFDGNWGTLTCGFYHELIREIEKHYGGPAKCYTGWVSRTSFEPHVVNAIFQKLVKREELIQVFLESRVLSVIREGNRVCGFTFATGAGEFEVRASIVIDATEFGDLIEMSGADFRLGRESREQTGEPDAPENPDLEIQDITYVAILKDYQKASGKNAPAVPASADYNPALFAGSTALDADDAANHNHMLHTWETFLDYGRLPNFKYMINWPFHANDFPDSISCFDRNRREEAFARAREHTLNYIHYMQTKLGHLELGIADNEFPTADGLPFLPYVRESRRIIGDVVMREQDVLPGPDLRPPLQKTAVAVGDYFLDHHHARAHPGHPHYFAEDYPDNAKFQVPFGVFFPRGLDGFAAAEKSISVTHIVNGCTRLQPIVLLMGQALGAICAKAIHSSIEPRHVPIRAIQEFLLVQQVMLYPYDDLPVNDFYFIEAQKLALSGVILKSEGFQFQKDRSVTYGDVAELLSKARGNAAQSEMEWKRELRTACSKAEDIPLLHDSAFTQPVSRAALAAVLCCAAGIQPVPEVSIRFLDMPHTHWAAKWIEPLYRREVYYGIWHLFFHPDKLVTRGELTLMIDRVFNPFHTLSLS